MNGILAYFATARGNAGQLLVGRRIELLDLHKLSFPGGRGPRARIEPVNGYRAVRPVQAREDATQRGGPDWGASPPCVPE